MEHKVKFCAVPFSKNLNFIGNEKKSWNYHARTANQCFCEIWSLHAGCWRTCPWRFLFTTTIFDSPEKIYRKISEIVEYENSNSADSQLAFKSACCSSDQSLVPDNRGVADILNWAWWQPLILKCQDLWSASI